MKRFLLRLARPLLIKILREEIFAPLRREAGRTHNKYDDKTVDWIEYSVIEFIEKL